jgi:hypothetical protein
VQKEDRFKQHTRSVWGQGHEAYDRWPAEWRAAIAPVIDALVGELRACTNEDELHARYWELGDWPADVLRRHLPCDPGPEALLEIEDAAFWLRCRELQPEAEAGG